MMKLKRTIGFWWPHIIRLCYLLATVAAIYFVYYLVMTTSGMIHSYIEEIIEKYPIEIGVIIVWVLWCALTIYLDYYVEEDEEYVTEKVTQKDTKKEDNIRLTRTFSGQTTIWNDYKSYFNRVAIGNNWSREERWRRLIISLRDQAETFINGLPDYQKDTIEKLMHQLEERFGPHKEKDIYLAEARARFLKKG